MEMSDGLGSDSDGGCSDSDNNETSYTLDNLCVYGDLVAQGNILLFIY